MGKAVTFEEYIKQMAEDDSTGLGNAIYALQNALQYQDTEIPITDFYYRATDEIPITDSIASAATNLQIVIIGEVMRQLIEKGVVDKDEVMSTGAAMGTKLTNASVPIKAGDLTQARNIFAHPEYYNRMQASSVMYTAPVVLSEGKKDEWFRKLDQIVERVQGDGEASRLIEECRTALSHITYETADLPESARTDAAYYKLIKCGGFLKRTSLYNSDDSDPMILNIVNARIMLVHRKAGAEGINIQDEEEVTRHIDYLKAKQAEATAKEYQKRILGGRTAEGEADRLKAVLMHWISPETGSLLAAYYKEVPSRRVARMISFMAQEGVAIEDIEIFNQALLQFIPGVSPFAMQGFVQSLDEAQRGRLRVRLEELEERTAGDSRIEKTFTNIKGNLNLACEQLGQPQIDAIRSLREHIMRVNTEPGAKTFMGFVAHQAVRAIEEQKYTPEQIAAIAPQLAAAVVALTTAGSTIDRTLFTSETNFVLDSICTALDETPRVLFSGGRKDPQLPEYRNPVSADLRDAAVGNIRNQRLAAKQHVQQSEQEHGSSTGGEELPPAEHPISGSIILSGVKLHT